MGVDLGNNARWGDVTTLADVRWVMGGGELEITKNDLILGV